MRLQSFIRECRFIVLASVSIIWVGGSGPRGVGELPAGGIRASQGTFSSLKVHIVIIPPAFMLIIPPAFMLTGI